MTAAREALTLPVLFLTVTLLGGVRVADRIEFIAPPPFSLVLAMILLGTLASGGVVAPQRLMDPSRSSLANLNGLLVLVSVFAASAQAFNTATPVSGIPRVLFHVLFLVLLLTTLAAAPDRVRVLRSLLVIFGSAFTLKFVVLAGLSDPSGGQMSRLLQVIFEGVTLGMVTQEVVRPPTAYLAFVTLTLFVFGLALLPAPPDGFEDGGLPVRAALRTTALPPAAAARNPTDEHDVR
jgi:hypothetical protein